MSARIEEIRQQIEFARQYTSRLIETVREDDWFRMPGEITHLAWQVGHLAMAEYGLVLFRQRGRQTSDLQLMSSRFRKQFSRGSTPAPDPAANPSVAELQETLQRVHEQALRELLTFPDEELDQPADMPYAVHPTRYGALLFCPYHEMLHAGQIGLLRRQLGYAPVSM